MVVVVAVAARHLRGALRLELSLQLRAQRLRQDRRPRRRRHRGRRRRVLDERLGVVDVALEVAARRAEGARALERLALLDGELAPLGFEVLRLDQGGDVLWSGGGNGGERASRTHNDRTSVLHIGRWICVVGNWGSDVRAKSIFIGARTHGAF